MKKAFLAAASVLVATGLFQGNAEAHPPPGFLHVDAKAGCVFGNAPHHWFKVSPGGLFFGLVFETDNMDAPAVAIEIAVTQEAYDKLPADVKKFYHNHADEIAMGDVTAPDLPPAEAKGTLEFLATTYGRMIIISEIADLAPIERIHIPTDPQSWMGTFWSYTPSE